MKKIIFNAIFIVSTTFSIVGIYSIQTQKVIFPFLNSVNIIGTFLTIVLIQCLYIYSARKNSKAYANMPKEKESKPRESVKSSVRLKDVAGLEEVKEEILEIIDFINNLERYVRVGAEIPKGILFYGPPGTGKTLLASALAGETNSSFLYASGAEFIEKYVGIGAKRVRELFEKAKEKAPCIIFIDEIDAIGGKRSNESQTEGNQTINQLLTEMDGFKEEGEENKLVIVIGATNRLDILDSALLRPGRFDKHIYIGNPNKIARRQILEVHTKNKPLSHNVNLEAIASKTQGLSGAHLSNIANEAAILAVRNNREVIRQEDFENAIERVIAGLKIKNSTIGNIEKKIISYHEAGHALVGKIHNIHSVEKISIIPTGMSLGYVLNSQIEDKYLYTKTELIKKIQSILAGRAAEEIVFGEVTTGAEDDLNKATEIVLGMICKYGMSSLGNRTFKEQMFNSSVIEINEEAKKMIDKYYEQTIDLLKENIQSLESIANYLLKKETITGTELNEILMENKRIAYNL